MLKDKKILLGVTGGIAAYKAVDLASKLSKMGAEVKTIMTSNACEFISPITIKSITHQPVVTQMFNIDSDLEHISLADWADVIVIAPATANIIGKTASGIADDLLSTTIMASKAPKLFVPAMNIHMFENPIVQANISKLNDLGYFFMEPEFGILACGYEGKGRYPDNGEIIYHIVSYSEHTKDLIGKNILVTTGANVEKIDPMRFISNFSSGKMGLAIARAAYIRGANVTFVHAKIEENIPEYLNSISAVTAQNMHNKILKEFDKNDITFMTAAVADYTPKNPLDKKIKKADNMQIEMMRTTDILEQLGKRKTEKQLLVGFAAESENIKQNAINKLKKKNLDYICANDLKVSGKNETEVTLLSKDAEMKFNGNKFVVANKIIDEIIKHNE